MDIEVSKFPKHLCFDDIDVGQTFTFLSEDEILIKISYNKETNNAFNLTDNLIVDVGPEYDVVKVESKLIVYANS